MSDYGEVARTASKAFEEALFKYEEDALREAIRIARTYGLDEDTAIAFAKQLAYNQREAMRRAGGYSY